MAIVVTHKTIVTSPIDEDEELPVKKEMSMYMKFQNNKYKYQSLKFNVIKTEHWFELVNSEYFKTSYEKYDELFKTMDMAHIPSNEYCEFMDHIIPNNVTIDNFINVHNHCNWKYVKNPKRNGAIPHRWKNLSGDFYQPFVLRYKKSVITGEILKAEALCPYCPCTNGKYNSNFYNVRNTDYLHHVTKTHMVYSNGTELNMPHIGKSGAGEYSCICNGCEKITSIGMELDLTWFIKHSWKHSKLSMKNIKLPINSQLTSEVSEPPFARHIDTGEWVKDGLTRFRHGKRLVWAKLMEKKVRSKPKTRVQFAVSVSGPEGSLNPDFERPELDVLKDLWSPHEQKEDQIFFTN